MKERLTFLEATSIIVGAGVGGGVMAVPYLASRSGLLSFLPIVLVAFALNVLLNLLLTEVLIRDGRDLQILELMKDYVFRGRIGEAISWIFFGVLGLAFISGLTAYVSGAGEVLSGLTGIPLIWCRIMTYGASALIVFFGLKSVGLSEKVAIALLLLFSVVILIGSLGAWQLPPGTFEPRNVKLRESLAVYGVVMYSLNAVFAVPQAVKGLGRESRRSVAAIITGTAINAALVLLVTLVAIAVSRPVTEIAVIGIGDATNRAVALAGSLFVIVAMLTTYWSASLALADIVAERLRTGPRLSWLVATAPTLVLLVAGLFGFIEYMQIAGGIAALVVVYVTVPMYLRVRRERPLEPGVWKLESLASPMLLTLFIAGMVLMAAGSFLGM